MTIKLTLNGRPVTAQIEDGMTLYEFVRSRGCCSVKCGCETSNCGLCTVFLNDLPVLSCSVLAARADGCRVDTLEGLQEEAEEFGAFIADQGAEQCGFCNPGMVMNAIALFRENPSPTDEEIKEYLAGNLCRCSGYEGQLRESMLLWSTKKEVPAHEKRETGRGTQGAGAGGRKRAAGCHEDGKPAGTEKGRHGPGNRETGISGGCAAGRLPGGKAAPQPHANAMMRRSAGRRP